MSLPDRTESVRRTERYTKGTLLRDLTTKSNFTKLVSDVIYHLISTLSSDIDFSHLLGAPSLFMSTPNDPQII